MADKEKPDISKEELEQFTKALKDEKFKKLFKDYVEELRDPANRELYEREISAMEREKGVDTTWIHPTPVYVVKSVLSDEPKEKIFINVCSSPDVEQASVKKNKGQHWTIPHILLTSTYRMDTDKSGNACRVQDVVFHPATLTKMGETNE
jgi:dynein assembly factor 2